MNALKRLETLEKREHKPSKNVQRCYLQRENRYVDALVVTVSDQLVAKLFGNLYKTQYSNEKKAYLVNTKYGKFRY